MSKQRPLRDIDLMKLLLDPRRSRILEIAADAPISVNELAERLGELPSRVYYHVHKLEEAGLVELVETRQHGNLIEKLYQSTGDVRLTIDPSAFGNHTSAVMKHFEQALLPGLHLVEHNLKLRAQRAEANPDDDPVHADDPQVRLNITIDTLTKSQWQAKLRRMTDEEPTDSESASIPHPSATEPSPNEPERRYAFIVLSYSQEDAEALGLLTNPSADDGD